MPLLSHKGSVAVSDDEHGSSGSDYGLTDDETTINKDRPDTNLNREYVSHHSASETSSKKIEHMPGDPMLLRMLQASAKSFEGWGCELLTSSLTKAVASALFGRTNSTLRDKALPCGAWASDPFSRPSSSPRRPSPLLTDRRQAGSWQRPRSTHCTPMWSGPALSWAYRSCPRSSGTTNAIHTPTGSYPSWTCSSTSSPARNTYTLRKKK